MKTMIAWWLINLTFHTRPLYTALSRLAADRAFRGANPLLVMLDGLAWMLIGILLALLVPVGLVTFPFTSLWLVCFDRANWKQLKGLVKEGRVDWRRGKIEDLAPAEEADNG